jgi:hypothetical protein
VRKVWVEEFHIKFAHPTRATIQTKSLEIEFEPLYFVLQFLGGQHTLRLIRDCPSMADYYPPIARAVSRLPSNTDEARRAIYERARTAFQESSRTLEISEAELASAKLALEAAIRRVEQDAAIETAVHRMERDLIPADMRQIVREENVPHAAPSFISRVKQLIRVRLRSRE